MTKILMVCLGNICRSPLAEGILKSKLPKENFVVDSAGTANYHIGEFPDKRSIEIAFQNDINITDQRGRQFKTSDFDYFDIIFVMDRSNFQNVIRLARNSQDKNKVRMILNELYPNENMDVPDPYYGGNDGFRNVFDLLNDACEIITQRLTSNH